MKQKTLLNIKEPGSPRRLNYFSPYGAANSKNNTQQIDSRLRSSTVNTKAVNFDELSVRDDDDFSDMESYDEEDEEEEQIQRHLDINKINDDEDGMPTYDSHDNDNELDTGELMDAYPWNQQMMRTETRNTMQLSVRKSKVIKHRSNDNDDQKFSLEASKQQTVLDLKRRKQSVMFPMNRQSSDIASIHSCFRSDILEDTGMPESPMTYYSQLESLTDDFKRQSQLIMPDILLELENEKRYQEAVFVYPAQDLEGMKDQFEAAEDKLESLEIPDYEQYFGGQRVALKLKETMKNNTIGSSHCFSSGYSHDQMNDKSLNDDQIQLRLFTIASQAVELNDPISLYNSRRSDIIRSQYHRKKLVDDIVFHKNQIYIFTFEELNEGEGIRQVQMKIFNPQSEAYRTERLELIPQFQSAFGTRSVKKSTVKSPYVTDIVIDIPLTIEESFYNRYITPVHKKQKSLDPTSIEMAKRRSWKNIDEKSIQLEVVSIQQNNQRSIEVLNFDQFVFYFTMKRLGDHYGEKTLFTLKCFDIEENAIKELKHFYLRDEYCSLINAEWIPCSIEIIKDHQRKIFELNSQSWKNKKTFYDIEEQFLQETFVVITYVEFYFSELDDPANNDIRIKQQVRNIKNFDKILLEMISKINLKQKFAIIKPDEISKLIYNENNQPLQIANQISLIHYEGFNEFKVYELTQGDKGELSFEASQLQRTFKRQSVYEYRDLILNNNYLYLYDEVQESFYFKKTQPIDEGTFIIDIMNNVLTNIGDQQYHMIKINLDECKLKEIRLDESVKKRQSNFYRSQTIQDELQGQMVLQQGNYGQQLLELPEFLQQSERSLSDHLAFFFFQKLKKKSLKKQFVINTKYKNVARCEDKIYIWQAHDTQPFKIKDHKLDLFQIEAFNIDVFKSDCTRKIVQKYRKKKYGKKFASMFLTYGKQNIRCISDKKERPIDIYDQLKLEKCEASILERTLAKTTLAKLNSEMTQQLTELDIQEENIITYERIRFDHDDRTLRPLIVTNLIKSKTKFMKSEALSELKIYFCIFDFHDEQIVQSQQITEPYVRRNRVDKQDWKNFIQNICLTQSSDIITKEPNLFKQIFQVAFSISSEYSVKILSFEVEYDHRNVLIGLVNIKLIGGREVHLTSSPESVLSFNINIELIPRLDKCNKVIGSQLILLREENKKEKRHIFIFENKNDDESSMPHSVLIDRQGYKLYRGIQDGKIYAVMAYVNLSDNLINHNQVENQSENQLGYMEKSEIIRGSLKSILNTIIYDPLEPFQRIQNSGMEPQIQSFLKQLKIGRPCELLDWFSLVSIYHMTINTIREMMRFAFSGEENTYGQQNREFNIQLSSLIERVMINDLERKFKLKKQMNMDMSSQSQLPNRLKLVKDNRVWLPDHSIIQRDIYFQTPLNYYSHLKKGLDIILQQVWNQNNLCQEARNHLMSNILMLISRKNFSDVFLEQFMKQNDKFQTNSEQKKQSHKNIKPLNIEQQLVINDSYYSYSDKRLQMFLIDLEDQYFNSNIEESLFNNKQKEMIKEEFVKGPSYPVDCFVLDLRYSIFQSKIELFRLKHRENHNGILDEQLEFHEDNSKKFTHLKLTQLVQTIFEKSNKDISNQPLMQDIINHQYESSSQIFTYMFLSYFFLFVVPFMVQMIVDEFVTITVCINICMFFQIGFITFEIIQCKYEGYDKYFQEIWNFSDLLLFFTYCIYYVLRQFHITLHGAFPQKKWLKEQEMDSDSLVLFVPMFHLVLVLLTTFKTLFYMRNFNGSREFVALILACIRDTSMFIVFLFIWVMIFFIMHIILGVEAYWLENFKKTGHYAYLPMEAAIFIQTWINSIGDFKVPRYKNIWDTQVKGAEEHKNLSYMYIAFIWFIWIAHQLLTQVILLNFLIAMVDSSFQTQQSLQTQVMYEHKCDVNYECAVFKEAWNRLKSSFCARKKDDTDKNSDVDDPEQEKNTNDSKESFNMIVVFRASENAAGNEQDEDEDQMFDVNYFQKYQKFINHQVERGANIVESNLGYQINKNFSKVGKEIQHIKETNEKEMMKVRNKLQELKQNLGLDTSSATPGDDAKKQTQILIQDQQEILSDDYGSPSRTIKMANSQIIKKNFRNLMGRNNIQLKLNQYKTGGDNTSGASDYQYTQNDFMSDHNDQKLTTPLKNIPGKIIKVKKKRSRKGDRIPNNNLRGIIEQTINIQKQRKLDNRSFVKFPLHLGNQQSKLSITQNRKYSPQEVKSPKMFTESFDFERAKVVYNTALNSAKSKSK